MRRVVAVIGAFGVLASGAAEAATLWKLGNHPTPSPTAQAEGPFGLRIDDDTGRNTFDFENGGAGVFFEITGADSARIHGTVLHNQSGQLWSLSSELGAVLTTNEDNGGVEPWYALADSLYDGILEDLILLGDSSSGVDPAGGIKDLSVPADRLTFSEHALTMAFLGDPADAVFDPDGDGDGLLALVGHPNVPGMVPMVIGKGANLPPGSETLSGLGWLTVEGEEPDFLRDYVFTFSGPVPEPTAGLLFGTGFLVCAHALRRRRA